MICSQCGAKINVGYKYCPFCGAPTTPSTEKNSASTSQNPTTGTTTTVLRKRPMPLWFKIIAALAVIALIGVTAGILFTESLVDIVDNQLEALRHEDIEKAYDAYTSKDFQRATSVDEFQEFITAYPIFIHNQSAHFTKRSLKDNIGTLRGNLTSPDHTKIPIEYKLIKEEGKWKILSVRLLKPDLLKSTNEPTNSQTLDTLVEKQLEMIKKGNVSAAYQDFSSKQFKEVTSEEEFLDFVKRYAILNHYDSSSISKTMVRNAVGVVSVALKKDKLVAYVKYYLVYEENQWKIWSMRILSPIEEENEEKSQQHANSLGSEKALQETDEAYVNVDIPQGTSGVIE